MRYTSFSPVFQTIFPSFFTLLRTAFSGNASTLSLKRKCISPETQARFPSNAEAFLHKHTRVFCTNIHIHALEGRKPRKNVAFQQNKYYFCNAITKNKSLPSRPCAWER